MASSRPPRPTNGHAHPSSPATGANERPARGRCAICGDEQAPSYRPFCSRRCADVDLSRWLRGGYAIASTDDDDDEDGEGTRDAGAPAKAPDHNDPDETA